MDFDLTEDRRMLSEMLTRYLTDQYPIEHRNEVAYTTPFHDPAKWSEMAELGVLFPFAPEEAGGFGGEGFDVTVVFEALGRGLCPEPILPAVMASWLLRAAEADQSELLAGSIHYGVAIGELDAPYALEEITTTASASGDAYAISGRKSSIYGGNIAEVFLVAARHGGGIGLFEVKAANAEVTGYGLIDGGGAAELFLDNTPARLVMSDAAKALQDTLDIGALALCAEAVGLMDVTKDTLLDYLRTRKQFGQTIGSFQALQHRAVDMVTEIEQARSITIFAASRIGESDQSRSVSMAKNLIGRTAKLVAEETIQMHGGIAMTWEYSASHYAKRLIMLDHQLGDTDYHLERVMAGITAA